MRQGEIVETAPVDDIFHAPRHPYTRQLLASTLKLERKSERRIALEAAMPVAREPILAVRGLTKRYGDVKGFFGFGADEGMRRSTVSISTFIPARILASSARAARARSPSAG
jgi:peptide/nickel transport system ATP-binding protein